MAAELVGPDRRGRCALLRQENSPPFPVCSPQGMEKIAMWKWGGGGGKGSDRRRLLWPCEDDPGPIRQTEGCHMNRRPFRPSVLDQAVPSLPDGSGAREERREPAGGISHIFCASLPFDVAFFNTLSIRRPTRASCVFTLLLRLLSGEHKMPVSDLNLLSTKARRPPRAGAEPLLPLPWARPSIHSASSMSLRVVDSRA